MNVILQLRSATIVLAIFAVANLATALFQINRMRNDSRVVNFAGIVRGASQRLIKLEMVGRPSDTIIASLDTILVGLIEGSEELELPAASDAEFRAAMLEVRQQWEQLKREIAAARDDAAMQSPLFDNSEAFWDRTNAAVFAAENAAKDNIDDLVGVQIALFVFNLLLLVGVWVVTENIARRLRYSVQTLASSSSEIASTVDRNESVASEQAAAVSQITTSIDELNASSNLTAEQAESAASDAREALTLTQTGNESVDRTLAGMETLREKVGHIADRITRLSAQTHEIGSISGLVSELAGQTNMLALNAAVEAVRAGEQGRGFSVVAAEIRTLADRSKQSAAKINELVGEIQNAINATVTSTEDGTKTVEDGVNIARKTARSFQGANQAVDRVVISSQQISLSAQQQVAAIAQIAEAMKSIDFGSSETARSIGQSRTGILQIHEIANQLKSLVEQHHFSDQ